MDLQPLLIELKKLGGRVAGSYARGEQRIASDLDIYVPEKNWVKVRTLLWGLDFHSTGIGQLCSLDYLPRIEVSWRFDRQPKSKKLSTVVIQGVEFSTW